jgi:hypothetical protein
MTRVDHLGHPSTGTAIPPVAVRVHAVAGGVWGVRVDRHIPIVAVGPEREQAIEAVAIHIGDVDAITVLIDPVVGDLTRKRQAQQPHAALRERASSTTMPTCRRR